MKEFYKPLDHIEQQIKQINKTLDEMKANIKEIKLMIIILKKYTDR